MTTLGKSNLSDLQTPSKYELGLLTPRPLHRCGLVYVLFTPIDVAGFYASTTSSQVYLSGSVLLANLVANPKGT